MRRSLTLQLTCKGIYKMQRRSRYYHSGLGWCSATPDVGHIGAECRQRDGILGKAGEERPIRGNQLDVQVTRRDDEFAIVSRTARDLG